MVRVPRRWVVAVGFLLLAVLALWLQDVIVPYTTPFWGLFDNQLDLDVYLSLIHI